jgi:hypothetical protein
MSAIEKQIIKYSEKRKANILNKGPKWLTEYCEAMIKGLASDVNLQELIDTNPTIGYVLNKN